MLGTRRFTRREALGLAAITGATLLAGCSSQGGSDSSTATSATIGDDALSILVKGYDWGPGVPAVLVSLPKEASSVETKDVKVTTARVERTLSDVFLCDENGEKVDGPASCVAFELETTNAVSGSPFRYDTTTLHNLWAPSYQVELSCNDLTIDGASTSLDLSADCIDRRVCPETALFSNRSSFSGTYHNDLLDQDDQLTLQTAAYEPSQLKESGNAPLVVWLNGQGEGGTDVDIELLGNKVVALAENRIQSHFDGDGTQGAFVLAVQTPTYWMDEGDGTNGNGSGVSRYTKILMDAVDAYVKSNPSVDVDRIYLGGCSNGGYMTMNMLINYPGYWAAAYPVCQAYSYWEYERNADGATGQSSVPTDTVWFTDEKVERLKDIPIWMTLSIDDPVVDPLRYELPDYRALVQAGAQDSWLSVFESVKGSDDPTATYIGHFSWIYLLNDEITHVQDRNAIAATSGTDDFGQVPSNDGGGSENAGEYDNLFDWLNAQSRE